MSDVKTTGLVGDGGNSASATPIGHRLAATPSPDRSYITEMQPGSMQTTPEASPRTLAAVAYSAACMEFNRAEAALKLAQDRVKQARAKCDELEREPPPPVDRTARELSGGKPETEDHREVNHATGLQKGYVVLTAAERGKGFMRPYRDAYRHLKCKSITTMARDIAETYARDPEFYSGTFCSTCRAHFPVGEEGEFSWYEMDGREGPKVGT